MKIVLTALTVMVICLVFANGSSWWRNGQLPNKYKYTGRWTGGSRYRYVFCQAYPESKEPGTKVRALKGECKKGYLIWTLPVSNPGPEYVLKVTMPGSNQKLCIQRIKIGQTICENSVGDETTVTLRGDPNGIGDFNTFSEKMEYTVTSLS